MAGLSVSIQENKYSATLDSAKGQASSLAGLFSEPQAWEPGIPLDNPS